MPPSLIHSFALTQPLNLDKSKIASVFIMIVFVYLIDFLKLFYHEKILFHTNGSIFSCQKHWKRITKGLMNISWAQPKNKNHFFVWIHNVASLCLYLYSKWLCKIYFKWHSSLLPTHFINSNRMCIVVWLPIETTNNSNNKKRIKLKQ